MKWKVERMWNGIRSISSSLAILLILMGSNLIINAPNDTLPITLSMKSNALFAGGSGTESDPYQISNATQLQNIDPTWPAYYILINDIDASETKSWNNGKGFSPIGEYNYRFSGEFDGQHYSINNLIIKNVSKEGVGLFGYVGIGARILNISIVNSYIEGDKNVGGFIGRNVGGILENCYFNGTIIGNSVNIGSIVGLNLGGRIKNCRANSSIEGHGPIGGLIGYSEYEESIIDHCEFNGRLTGYGDIIGGIAGWNDGTIRNTNANSTIMGYGGKLGGMVGRNLGFIYQSTYKGDIIGDYKDLQIGGFVGYHTGMIQNCSVRSNIITNSSIVGGFIGDSSGSVYNSSFIGKVQGNNDIGGFIGDQESDQQIFNCYSIGSVIGNSTIGGFIGVITMDPLILNSYTSTGINGSQYVGGFIGGYVSNGPTIINCFYNNETYKGQPVGDGFLMNITGIDNEDMKTGRIFIDSNWDFNKVWDILETITFPYHRWEIQGQLKIDQIDDQIISEDEDFEINLSYTCIDAEEKETMWFLETPYDWLHIDNENKMLFGTPKNYEVGTWKINLSLRGNRTSGDDMVFSILVINTNDAPSINTTNILDAIEDSFFNSKLNAFDIDPTNDILLWSMRTNSDFLELESEKNEISGIPLNNDVGTWWIAINLSDGNGGFDEANLTLIVQNVNDAPEILSLIVPEVQEDVPFFIDIEAVDIDPTNDVLNWNLDTNAAFIDLDTDTGNISGIPTNIDIGSWWVNVSVSDGNGGIDQWNFTLTVLNVNDGPILKPGQILFTLNEDSHGTFDLDNVFYDIDGDTLFFEHGLSDNFSISLESTSVTIIPDPNWCGEEMVRFTASDEFLSISTNVTIVVIPLNDAPTDVRIYAEPSYFKGADQTVNSSATDVDVPFGDELTFTWFSNISGDIGTGRSIDLSLPIGHHLVTLRVTDKANLSANQTIMIEIKAVEMVDDDDGNGSDSRPPLILITLGVTFILLIIVLMSVILFMMKKKKEGEQGPDTNTPSEAPSAPDAIPPEEAISNPASTEHTTPLTNIGDANSSTEPPSEEQVIDVVRQETIEPTLNDEGIDTNITD